MFPPRKLKQKTPIEMEQDRILLKAREDEITFEWENDLDPDLSYMSHRERNHVEEVLYCIATHPDGRVITSENITDPDSSKRRQVEAQLAFDLGVRPDYTPPEMEDMHTQWDYNESLDPILEEDDLLLEGELLNTTHWQSVCEWIKKTYDGMKMVQAAFKVDGKIIGTRYERIFILIYGKKKSKQSPYAFVSRPITIQFENKDDLGIWGKIEIPKRAKLTTTTSKILNADDTCDSFMQRILKRGQDWGGDSEVAKFFMQDPLYPVVQDTFDTIIQKFNPVVEPEDMHTQWNYNESILLEGEGIKIPAEIWEKAGVQMMAKNHDLCEYKRDQSRFESSFTIGSRDALSWVKIVAYEFEREFLKDPDFWMIYKISFHRSDTGRNWKHYLYDFQKVPQNGVLPESLTAFVADFSKGLFVYSKTSLDTPKHQKIALADLKKKTPELEQIYGEWLRLVTAPPEMEDMHAVWNYNEEVERLHLISRALIESDPSNLS